MSQPMIAAPWSWPSAGDAPTGIQLFGHPPSGPADHWAGLQPAHLCLTGVRCHEDFYVFAAWFHAPTSFVEIKTAMLHWAIDGAELWAYDSAGRRIAECTIPAITPTVLVTGVMPNPVYGTRILPPRLPAVECGKVTGRTFCVPGGDPGECRFDVTAWIRRPNRDIAFVLWGAVGRHDSTAPVDALRYDF